MENNHHCFASLCMPRTFLQSAQIQSGCNTKTGWPSRLFEAAHRRGRWTRLQWMRQELIFPLAEWELALCRWPCFRIIHNGVWKHLNVCFWRADIVLFNGLLLFFVTVILVLGFFLDDLPSERSTLWEARWWLNDSKREAFESTGSFRGRARWAWGWGRDWRGRRATRTRRSNHFHVNYRWTWNLRRLWTSANIGLILVLALNGDLDLMVLLLPRCCGCCGHSTTRGQRWSTAGRHPICGFTKPLVGIAGLDESPIASLNAPISAETQHDLVMQNMPACWENCHAEKQVHGTGPQVGLGRADAAIADSAQGDEAEIEGIAVGPPLSVRYHSRAAKHVGAKDEDHAEDGHRHVRPRCLDDGHQGVHAPAGGQRVHVERGCRGDRHATSVMSCEAAPSRLPRRPLCHGQPLAGASVARGRGWGQHNAARPRAASNAATTADARTTPVLGCACRGRRGRCTWPPARVSPRWGRACWCVSFCTGETTNCHTDYSRQQSPSAAQVQVHQGNPEE